MFGNANIKIKTVGNSVAQMNCKHFVAVQQSAMKKAIVWDFID